MWALVFLLSALVFLGSLGALFLKRLRQRASWAALASLAVVSISSYQVAQIPDDPTRSANLSTTGTATHEARGATPLSEAQARSLATTALAPVNDECQRSLTIVENPPALPDQHVLTVRCGDGATGRVYQVREAQAAQAPASRAPVEEPRAPPPPPQPSYDLDVISWNCTEEYGYQQVDGEVKNLTDEPISNLMVVASFYTSSGEFIKSADAMVEYDPLLPGQRSPFSAITTGNPAITKCNVGFKQMFGGALSVKP